MDLSNLKPAKGSTKKKLRLGRGQGSGKGGTAGKGHKGQQSRSGYKTLPWFEGGQMPIQRRLPKFGFKNINRKEFKPVNLNVINELAEKKNLDTIDLQVFIDAGLASKNSLVKILAAGELKKKVDIKAHAFSKKAKESIESLGGKAETI
jgi:large subunit ribosomal protein L15